MYFMQAQDNMLHQLLRMEQMMMYRSIHFDILHKFDPFATLDKVAGPGEAGVLHPGLVPILPIVNLDPTRETLDPVVLSRVIEASVRQAVRLDRLVFRPFLERSQSCVLVCEWMFISTSSRHFGGTVRCVEASFGSGDWCGPA